MGDEFGFPITPLMRYITGDISKKDLERKLDNASGNQLSKSLVEARDFVGHAYMSNLASKRKALKTVLIPTAIAGTLGLLGKFLGVIPQYESAAYLAGFIGSLCIPISCLNYLDSESTRYLRKAKKAARIVAKSIYKVRGELPYLVYDLEDIQGRIVTKYGGMG